MKRIRSFSGTHAFKVEHVIDSIELDWFGEFEPEQLRVLAEKRAKDVAARLRDGSCPRCDGALDRAALAGSRVTSCRCIPICSLCGADEAFQPMLGRPMSRVWQWPISRGHRTRRRNKMMGKATVTTGIISGSTIITEHGATPLDTTPRTGGWAEFGLDEEVARG